MKYERGINVIIHRETKDLYHLWSNVDSQSAAAWVKTGPSYSVRLIKNLIELYFLEVIKRSICLNYDT